jgi:hypothetical protein
MLTKTSNNGNATALQGPREITGRTLAHTPYTPAERVKLGAQLVSGEVALVRMTRGQAAAIVRAHIDHVADYLKPHRNGARRAQQPRTFESFIEEFTADLSETITA